MVFLKASPRNRSERYEGQNYSDQLLRQRREREANQGVSLRFEYLSKGQAIFVMVLG
jgi:hypothetical protein